MSILFCSNISAENSFSRLTLDRVASHGDVTKAGDKLQPIFNNLLETLVAHLPTRLERLLHQTPWPSNTSSTLRHLYIARLVKSALQEGLCEFLNTSCHALTLITCHLTSPEARFRLLRAFNRISRQLGIPLDQLSEQFVNTNGGRNVLNMSMDVRFNFDRLSEKDFKEFMTLFWDDWGRRLFNMASVHVVQRHIGQPFWQYPYTVTMLIRGEDVRFYDLR